MLTSRAISCPIKPALAGNAFPSGLRPRPLMCECGAIREDLEVVEVVGTWMVGAADVLAIFWARGKVW